MTSLSLGRAYNENDIIRQSCSNQECIRMGQPRVSFSFLPKGDKMRLCEFFGGQVYVQSMWQTRGFGAMLPWEILTLDLIFDVFWWNLGLFLHKHNLPFIITPQDAHKRLVLQVYLG